MELISSDKKENKKTLLGTVHRLFLFVKYILLKCLGYVSVENSNKNISVNLSSASFPIFIFLLLTEMFQPQK
jgi:hypothetical protein